MNENMPIRNANFSGSRLRLALTDSKLSDQGIQLTYVIGIIVWLIMAYFLNIWSDTSLTTKCFLALPIAVCVSNIITPVHGSDIVLDPQVTQGNLLSYILIGASILAPWLSKVNIRRRWHHTRVIKVFVVMVLLLTLSQFDFFALRVVSDIEIHTNTIINTYALAFIGFCISEFFHIEYRLIDKWAPRDPYHEPHPWTAGDDGDEYQRTEKDQENINKATAIAASQINQNPGGKTTVV